LHNSFIVGVDNSVNAIKTAIKYYNAKNIYYELKDAQKYNSMYIFSTITCLETIEHLDNPIKFLYNLRKLTKKKRTKLIISCPLNEKKGDNEFHKHVFSENEFIKMIKNEIRIEFIAKQVDGDYIIISGTYV
jgi:hypothetical protein